MKALKILDLGIEYSIYGFILCIPVSIALVSIFASLAVSLFLIKQVLSPDLSGIRSNKIFFLLFLVFFIFMSLSLFNSGPLLAKSLKALFFKWGRFFFILWMILDIFRDSRRIVKAAGFIFFSAMMIGFSALSQKFMGYEFFRHMPLCGGIITGPFPNQNGLGAYLTGVIPVVLCISFWKFQRTWVKVGFILIALMLMIISFWTYCRGGWVGLTAGMISVILLINHNRYPKKIFWALFSVGNLICVPLTAFVLFFFQGRGDSARFIIYRGAWKMITEHPFLGKGLGTFMNYSAQYTHIGIYYVHNCFLQIWAESGIFSLLSFLLLNGYFFYKSITMILKMPASLNSYILIGLNAGLLGFLVHSFFDTQFYSFQASFLYWTLLGLTIALSRAEGNGDFYK